MHGNAGKRVIKLLGAMILVYCSMERTSRLSLENIAIHCFIGFFFLPEVVSATANSFRYLAKNQVFHGLNML